MKQFIHFLSDSFKIDKIQMKLEKNKSPLIYIKYLCYFLNFISFTTFAILLGITFFHQVSLSIKYTYLLVFIIILSYFLESFIDIHIHYHKETFLIFRFIFILASFIYILFTIFNTNLINKIVHFSPRISLLVINLIFTFIFSFFIYSLLFYFTMIFKRKTYTKLFIIYSYKVIIYIFITIGIFTTLYLKDKIYFLTIESTDEIHHIIQDSSNIYIQFILLFFMHNIWIKYINQKIDYIKNQNTYYNNSKYSFMTKKFKNKRK